MVNNFFFFFFQAEDGIRDLTVTGVQTCALPILRFRPLHLRETLRRDRDPVGHPARKARCRRCIPYRKPELARGMPDIRLPQPRLGERRAHARRLPGGVPGAVLAQVVGVRTVAHDGEPAAPRRRDEPAPQLRLAEEATVRRIREIVGILELVPVELDQGGIEALRHRPRRRPLGHRVGGAATHARQHPLASQLLPQHDGQQGRIDPARVADEGRWIGPDEGAQLGGWCLGSGHGGIVAAYTVSIKGHERIVRRPETYYPYDTFKNYDKRLLLVGKPGYRGSEMAHKTELDAVDRKILRLLATDGRSSYQALADEVGLSRPAAMA